MICDDCGYTENIKVDAVTCPECGSTNVYNVAGVVREHSKLSLMNFITIMVIVMLVVSIGIMFVVRV